MRHLVRSALPVLLLATSGSAIGLGAAALPHAPLSSISDTIDDPDTGIHLDFTVNGGTITESSLDGFDYTIRGTVRPGETISIAVSGNGTTFTPDHHANDDLDGTVSIDFPGPDHDERAVLPVGTSVSLAGSYVVPGDESAVEIAVLLGNAWINPNGGGSRSLIVRCTFEVVEPGPAEPDPDPQAPRPTPTRPTADCDSPDEGGTNSGIVRFGDLHGEVDVRPNWEDDDAYVFAELSTPLYHCDRIRTLPRSGAILSFSDMATFVMREDSVIVLDIDEEGETKLGHIAGVIWVNFNRMIEDGSMEVEMGQAIAGARGTTFICEETGETSTVKVVEGTVEVTPDLGAPVLVGPGEMVTVTADGAGTVERFDVDAEMAGWPEEAQEITADALAAADSEPAADDGSRTDDDAVTLIAAAAIGLAIVLVGIGAIGLVATRSPRAARR